MHAFRHGHASLLMEVGANPTVAKQQMRHSDARITLGIYGHVIGDSQRNAGDKVGELLRPEFCAQVRPNSGGAVSRFTNLRNAPAEKFPLRFRDGLLEIDPDSHDENDGETGQASRDIDWYQAQARLAKKVPTKKWWTILDMEQALRMT